MNRVVQLLAALGGEKLGRDILYTLLSFVVLAASGMVINVVITVLRDPAALGVFNQAYAVYILASQLATFGLHYSVLRFASLHDGNFVERGRALATAAACALVGGTLVALPLFTGEALLGRLFESGATGRAIAFSALGLTLFPLNKVLLSYLNALRRMRAYSLLQMTRYSSIMLLVSMIAASSAPIEYTSIAFIGAEAVTATAALVYLYRISDLTHWSFSRAWVGNHLQFGARGLIAGAFAEFNSRVDVLLIGLFLPDRSVGVYSFAAMLADGVYHVLAMVRINFNPLLIRAMRDRDWSIATNLLTQSKNFIWAAIFGISLTALLAFWVLANYVTPDKALTDGIASLAILLAGLTVVSFLIPFDNLLMVTGFPGHQTLQQLAMVTTNVVVGVLLLPYFGIEGVALGTSLSYFAGISVLILFARKLVGWNLLTNRIWNK